jgi:LEA14-like dessication related protein
MLSRCGSFLIVALTLLSASCGTPGPVVPTPPSVEVTQLDSLVIAPDVIEFQAKVLIKNRMGARLDLQRIDYGADVHDKQAFTDSFAQLYPVKANAHEVVTFPFHIAMKDIAARAVDVLAEEGIRVRFRGQVYPVGFDPVAFEASKTIPLPKLPAITLEGTQGSPADRIFTVLLKVKNTNAFPLDIKSIKSYLELNGTKYSLLRTDQSTQIPPGSAQTVALQMEQSTAKSLSMVLNVLQSESFQFAVGGDISCQTPYGLVYVPLRIQSQTKL